MNIIDRNNNGFSLVELVIVIAIMAILVALLAPQYIRYVEKSKLTADEDMVTNIHNAIALAVTDENIKNKPLDGIPMTSIQNMDPSNLYPDFMAQIMDDLGETNLSLLSERLQSRNYKGQPILVEITSLQKVTVTVPALFSGVPALTR